MKHISTKTTSLIEILILFSLIYSEVMSFDILENKC